MELDTLTRIGAFAEQALRLSIRLINSEMASTSLGEALTRVGMGVFVLDSLGRVIFTNPAGERLIGQGLAIDANRLVAQFSADREKVGAAITAILESVPGALLGTPKPLLLRQRDRERPLTLYVLPVRSSDNPVTDQFLARARAIVLAIEGEADAPPDPAVVRDVLGLTLGEARVAALVGHGLPPREAAAKLGITEETARTALKRVFSKVGVSRQSELAALLTRLVVR